MPHTATSPTPLLALTLAARGCAGEQLEWADPASGNTDVLHDLLEANEDNLERRGTQFIDALLAEGPPIALRQLLHIVASLAPPSEGAVGAATVLLCRVVCGAIAEPCAHGLGNAPTRALRPGGAVSHTEATAGPQ